MNPNQFSSMAIPSLTLSGFNSLHIGGGYNSQSENLMNFTEPLEEWSCESVAQWLAINDLSEHIESFLENRIDGEKLQNIDSNKLKVSSDNL